MCLLSQMFCLYFIFFACRTHTHRLFFHFLVLLLVNLALYFVLICMRYFDNHVHMYVYKCATGITGEAHKLEAKHIFRPSRNLADISRMVRV